MVVRQPLQGESERLHRAFETLEQIYRHQGLNALLSSALLEITRATCAFGIIQPLVFVKAAGLDVADRRIHGELHQRELIEDFIEADDIAAMGELAVEGDRLEAFREGADVLGIVKCLNVSARAGDGDAVQQLKKVEVE